MKATLAELIHRCSPLWWILKTGKTQESVGVRTEQRQLALDDSDPLLAQSSVRATKSDVAAPPPPPPPPPCPPDVPNCGDTECGTQRVNMLTNYQKYQSSEHIIWNLKEKMYVKKIILADVLCSGVVGFLPIQETT